MNFLPIPFQWLLCWLILLVPLASWNPTVAQPAVYDTNSLGASMDINGITGTTNSLAVANLTAWSCTSGIVPATASLNFSSDAGVSGASDIVVSSGPVAAFGAGGVAFPTGQILNVSFLFPLFFINGGFLPQFNPVPAVPVSVSISSGSQLDVTIQAIVVNAAAPGGFDMTQPTEVHVAVSPPLTSLPGPTDNTFMTIDVTAPPYCWAAGGIPMYGTTYTQMHVTDNGRVTFNIGNAAWSPSTSFAMSGPPFVGLWGDFNPVPALGGSVMISTTPFGYIRIDYQNVIYGNLGGASNVFYIEFDWFTGSIEIGGLAGFIPHPNNAPAFLGISPGSLGSATDPGAVNFSPSASPTGGFAVLPTDMIYDFGPTPLQSLTAGVSQIFFVPTGGNYAWASL